ncbi:MAG TPA: SDR family NAD(P)-dependent oxidoreductase [Pusillimonas sp.]
MRPQTAETNTMTAISVSRPHSGRVALVTGSTSGIGLAIAGRLASLGADIALHGLGKPEDIEHVVKALRKRHDVHVQHFEGDFTDSSCFVPMIECIAAALGAPDILINNAGMQYVSPILSFPPEKWDMMLAVNLSASFHTIRLCAPAMLKKGWGRIINMASVSGLVGVADKPAYVATKHGLVGLTKSVALEFVAA